MADQTSPESNPPAQGVRLAWAVLPAYLRARIDEWLGSPVVQAHSQSGGFSPGVAARLQLADGRRCFVKAVSAAQNPDAPKFYRREAQIAAALPPSVPAPRLLWSYDDGEWVVLLFEDIAGQQPRQPWQPAELDRVIAAMVNLANQLTPSPLPAETTPKASERVRRSIKGWQELFHGPAELQNQLDPWSLRHLAALAQLEEAAPAAVEGHTLLHFDLRADNMLLTDSQVWFVDWPHACHGAAWLDLVFFAPSVKMQGGPAPEELLKRYLGDTPADAAAITAGVAATAGFFTFHSLLPAPPGLPTLRAFQAAQGEVARQWVAQRTGLA